MRGMWWGGRKQHIRYKTTEGRMMDSEGERERRMEGKKVVNEDGHGKGDKGRNDKRKKASRDKESH